MNDPFCIHGAQIPGWLCKQLVGRSCWGGMNQLSNNDRTPCLASSQCTTDVGEVDNVGRVMVKVTLFNFEKRPREMAIGTRYGKGKA